MKRASLLAAALAFSSCALSAGDLSTTNQDCLGHFSTAVAQKQRPVTILSFGDSMADSWRSIGVCLMNRLVAQWGVAGYSLDNYCNTLLLYLSGGAQWLGPDAFWYGYHVQIPPGGAAWSVNLANGAGLYADSVTLFYVAHTNGGAFNLLIATNGGPWGTLPLNGYSPNPTGCVANVALPPNYYKLRVEGLSGTNLIIGPRFLNSRSTGVNVAFSYYPGIALQDVTRVPLDIRAPIFRELAPDLLIWHMKEDGSETSRQGLIECEQWWSNAVPNCDVLYIGTPWISRDTTSTWTIDQNTLVRSVAVSCRRTYVDCLTPAVSYPWMLAQGFMADETHETLRGNQYLEEFVSNDLGFSVTPTAPAIINQAASNAVTTGNSVTLTADVSGTPPFTCQWFCNAAPLTGATNLALTISRFEPANIGTYVITASNAVGSATGTVATLTLQPIVLNSDFETGSFNNWTLSGNTAYVSASSKSNYAHSGSYGVQAGPVGAPGYLSQRLTTTPGQPYLLSLWLDCPDSAVPNEFSVSWNGATLFDGLDLGTTGWTNLQFIVGATSASSLLQLGVRNDHSFFGLDDITLTPLFSLSPHITVPPVSRSLPIGATASVAVAAVGTEPLAYQWYFNTNTPVAGATNAVLALGRVTTNQAGNYHVVVSNRYGSITSSPATLTVQLVPNIYQLSNGAGGAKILSLASSPGSTNRLWASTNLADWQVIATNSADTSGFFQITDTNAVGHSMMFYRLSSP